MYALVSALSGILILQRFPAPTPEEHPVRVANVHGPKLLLILVIDQFRYDYLERFRPYFVGRGFNLLLGGANFVDCRYDYATTVTCAGHATLLTGAYPNVHGIIANEWFDNRSYRKVYCAEDSGTTLVGGPVGPGMSPRKLMGSTLGDELRLATGFQSKVVAISLKDRSSIMPGGHGQRRLLVRRRERTLRDQHLLHAGLAALGRSLQSVPSREGLLRQSVAGVARNAGSGRPGPEAVHPWLISATVPRQSIPRLAQRDSIHDRDRIKLRP